MKPAQLLLSAGVHHHQQHEDDFNTRGGGRDMVGTAPANFSILLLIPEEVYMAELYKRHEFKHQTKYKISFLESSVLFQNFAYDDLVKMSYSINKKIFPKGSVIAKQGSRAGFVVLVQKGTILIYQKLSKGAKKRSAKTSIVAFPGDNDQHHEDQLVIDIAKIGSHDVFGVVEAVTKSKKMKREAVASTDVEAFLIQVPKFLSFFEKEPRSMKFLEKIVENRLKWEALRQDFAMRFSNSMPLSLPKNTNTLLSNYQLLHCYHDHDSAGDKYKSKSKRKQVTRRRNPV